MILIVILRVQSCKVAWHLRTIQMCVQTSEQSADHRVVKVTVTFPRDSRTEREKPGDSHFIHALDYARREDGACSEFCCS